MIINSTWYYSGCYSKPHTCLLICHFFLIQHLGYLISSWKSQESPAPAWVLIEYVLHNRIKFRTSHQWQMILQLWTKLWWEWWCKGDKMMALEYHMIWLYKSFKDIPGWSEPSPLWGHLLPFICESFHHENIKIFRWSFLLSSPNFFGESLKFCLQEKLGR